MMTDIVERLRDAASRLIDGKADDVAAKIVLLDNAAFEIERLRAAAQSAWQPIETAPRDGSPIEVCNTRLPMLPPVIVRWLDELSNPDTGWCDAATASGDALYYNANYFDFWKPTTALPSAEREGATPSAPDASAPAQRPRE